LLGRPYLQETIAVWRTNAKSQQRLDEAVLA